MLSPVLLLHISLAVITHVGLVTTGLYMVDPDLYLEGLLAPLTLLRAHIALLLMVAKLNCRRRIGTILTLHGLVGRLLMLLSIGLGHDIAALSALVVLTSASDLVHPNLAHLNGSLTG